jgi:hypothetical protein
LIALLLPAIQAAREAARRMECSNHLKQLALGCLNHENALKFFPTGGWVWTWMGDPDQGFGKMQPGGWTFNILPYTENRSIHDLAKNQTPAVKKKTLALMGGTSISVFYCPTRRPATVYPNPTFQCVNTDPISLAARTDYAANGGTAVTPFWDPPNVGGDPTKVPSSSMPDYSNENGMIYPLSTVPVKHVRNGLSHTYLIGEKYLIPDHYTDGLSDVDNNPLYAGYDWDWHRWGGPEPIDLAYQPARDRRLRQRAPRGIQHVLRRWFVSRHQLRHRRRHAQPAFQPEQSQSRFGAVKREIETTELRGRRWSAGPLVYRAAYLAR